MMLHDMPWDDMMLFNAIPWPAWHRMARHGMAWHVAYRVVYYKEVLLPDLRVVVIWEY